MLYALPLIDRHARRIQLFYVTIPELSDAVAVPLRFRILS